MNLKKYTTWAACIALAVLLLYGYTAAFGAPTDFPSGSIVRIERGASASAVASQLADSHIIAYPTLLVALLRISGGSDRIQAGPYIFKAPENVFTIAYRLLAGDYGIPPVRITFPEGETVREIADRVHAAFPDIAVSDFASKARRYEGYLFPDTYFFAPSSDADAVIKVMRENFDAKTAPLSSEISASGHTLSDIIVMASLVEKEGRTSPVRRMIAGILYNRLRLGMPLQTDAVFGYIFNRDTYSPTYDDLKVDSPYNTYLHTGLPPGPINNPGVDSIDAALNPTKTKYLYYLTDKEGIMHYATTYAEHQANERKYLR